MFLNLCFYGEMARFNYKAYNSSKLILKNPFELIEEIK